MITILSSSSIVNKIVRDLEDVYDLKMGKPKPYHFIHKQGSHNITQLMRCVHGPHSNSRIKPLDARFSVPQTESEE